MGLGQRTRAVGKSQAKIFQVQDTSFCVRNNSDSEACEVVGHHLREAVASLSSREFPDLTDYNPQQPCLTMGLVVF